MTALLDQKRNYSADFGLIFRSSGIFYIPKDTKFTLSLSNYWKFKNNMDVTVIATVRDMDGRVVSRTPCDFSNGPVFNMVEFGVEEGSVEVEAFGNTNLRVPYAAIMGIYEAEDSVSMVHSYSRNHSLIEIEDAEALTLIREGCWSVRAEPGVTNTAVFHCGHTGLEAQTATLTLIDADGKTTEYPFDVDAQAPFVTLKFKIDDIVPDYKSVLGHRHGWASLHFDNASAFSRLLILWQTEDGRQLQVTHSNFDYDSLTTDTLPEDAKAVMRIPSILDKMETTKLVVYPRMAPGRYNLRKDGETSDPSLTFESGVSEELEDDRVLAFSREGGGMPSRLVTALQGRMQPDALPFECSLGIFHSQRPKKRFYWASVSAAITTRIHLETYTDLYGTEGEVLCVWRLYSASKPDYLETSMTYASPLQVPSTFELDELFPDARAHLGEEPGYISLFSPWGGFQVFTSMERDGAFTIEHSF